MKWWKSKELEQRLGIVTYEGLDYVWQMREEIPLTADFRYRLPPWDEDLEFTASRVGLSPDVLQRITELHIHRGHPTATLVDGAHSGRPEFYLLGVGSLWVVYSVESGTVVVRGYGPNLPTHMLGEILVTGWTCDIVPL